MLLLLSSLAATSSELTEVKTYTDTGYRIDYLDEQGNKAMATDKGYATVVRTVDGDTATVFYFDQHGEPVALSSGQYGKIGWYNEKGEDVRITYLDAAGNVMNLNSGYATTVRTFENGQMVQEMYLAKDGAPAVLSLGQSGYVRTFDDEGHVSSITYLDGDGNVLVTRKGYDTVIKEYDEAGNLLYDRFYLGGEPTAADRGQYGVKYLYENGKQTGYILIDANGEQVFVLSLFLGYHLWICILACLLLVVVPVFLGRKVTCGLLAAYVVFILYMTLARTTNEGINLELFWSYKQFLTKSDLALQIVDNILLFVPFGALLYCVWPSGKTILVSVAFSIAIEITQYIGGFGLCELDDIVSNTLGGAFGCLCGWIVMVFRRRRRIGRKEE